MPRLGKMIFHYGRPYSDLLDKLYNVLMFMRKSDYWIYQGSITYTVERVVDDFYIKHMPNVNNYKLGDIYLQDSSKSGWFIIEIKKVDKIFRNDVIKEANKLLKALNLGETDEIVINQRPNKIIISKIINNGYGISKSLYEVIPITDTLYNKYRKLEPPFQIKK